MNDRPTVAELLDAVRGYLEKELLPTVNDPRLRFQTLIAANVLSIASREVGSEEALLIAEKRDLEGLLGEGVDEPGTLEELRERVRRLNERVCEQIREGAYDALPWRSEALDVVRRQVIRKLEVANPRYLRGSAP